MELFHTKADAHGFGINFDDLHFNSLTNGQNFRWMINPTPCNICDVKQTIDTAKVNKCTIIGDVLDDAFSDLTLGKILYNLTTGFRTCLFHNRPTRYNNITATTIHFQNLERLRRVHQRGDVTDRTNIDLAARQESCGAIKVNCKATLHTTENNTGHTFIGFK